MRLSEFKDEKAIEVVANLLEPISKIAINPENKKATANKAQFAAAILKNNATDILTMLAILSDKDPKEYHCTAASVLADVLDMLNDPELMELFGLQSQINP